MNTSYTVYVNTKVRKRGLVLASRHRIIMDDAEFSSGIQRDAKKQSTRVII